MAAEGNTIDALSQFQLVHALGPIGASVNFSQSNAFMLLGAGLILAFMAYGMRPAALVPGRLQAAAEMAHEFVANMVRERVGEGGRPFFPFVFAIFMFVLSGNMLGMLPYSFTFTSHIAVTFALAMVVFVVITVVAIVLHGTKFFRYFLPEGMPVWLAPIIIPIEILSYLARPVSLSIRLFANMTSGHIMVAVFGTFVVLLGTLGTLGPLLAILPLSVNVALVALKLLVAFLQAYVFAMLTCIYLHDAVHLH